MDFIEQLPLSGEFDCILVICDPSSKQVILIPCDIHITSASLAWLFRLHVFSKHGIPSHVTCDRGTEFILAFFRSLAELLSMEMHYTSGNHPLADGQTERMNQTVEQYIRIFCSYQQDDWDKLLPLAEFALNNTPNTSTGMSPFYAHKGYNLAIMVHLERNVANTYTKDFAVDLQDLHQFLREQNVFARPVQGDG
jgi:IS30 family transposase